MDVTCESCGTEYEFDETLVSSRGTTVKCTQCGHLFKVFRQSDPSAGTDAGRPWSVRRKDGSIVPIASLRVLQRMITQGEVTDSEEISRSGEAWKKLGDIAELQTFFAAARAGSGAHRMPGHADSTIPFAASRELDGGRPTTPRSDRPPGGDGAGRPAASGRPLRPTPPSVPAPGRSVSGAPRKQPSGAPPKQQSAPPPRAPAPAQPKRTVLGVGAGAGSVSADQAGLDPVRSPASAAPSPSPSPGGAKGSFPKSTVLGVGAAVPIPDAYTPPLGSAPLHAYPAAMRPPPPPNVDGPAPFAPAVDARRRAMTPTDRIARQAPSAGAAGLYVAADENPYSAAPPKRGSGLLVVGLLALGAVGATAWFLLRPEAPAPARDVVAEFLRRGEESLRADTEPGYEAALLEFTRASGVAEHDARVLAALGRLYGVWAQNLEFALSDERASQTGGGESALGARLNADRTAKLEQARAYAENAVRQDPTSADAELALSDAFRLSGDRGAARSHLDRARSLLAQPTAELFRVSALLAVAEGGGNLGLARPDGERAVARDPALIRARLLLARALQAAGDRTGARAQLDAVLQQVAGHPRASALAARWASAQDSTIVAASPTSPTAPTGAQVQAPDAGRTPTLVQAPPGPAAGDQPGGTPRPAPGGSAAVTVGAAGSTDVPPAGRDHDWYVREANAALERGAVPRARAFLEQALVARPGSAEATAGLGYVALENGTPAVAAEQFQRATRAGYAPAYIGLGEAYRALGRLADALAAYEAYLERSPAGAAASIAREQVRILRERLGGPGSGEGSPQEGGEPPASSASPPGGVSAPALPPVPVPAPPAPAPPRAPVGPVSDPPALEEEP